MCQGVSDVPGQMWSWGCAQPLQGFSSLLDSVFPLLRTEIGLGNPNRGKTCELPLLVSAGLHGESLYSWQPGVSKVTPAGRIRTTELPD